MVFEAKDQYASQWAAIESISAKIGCTAETLRRWVSQGERDHGARDGPTAEANEILKLACASFAQAELDRRLKS